MLRIILGLLLLCSVLAYLKDLTPDFPTSTSAPNSVHTTTSEQVPQCSCYECEDASHKSTHTQTEFCNSDAVILGRIYQRTNHSKPAGIWKSEDHNSLSQSALEEHYEYSVRVIQVYSNPGRVKIALGDKITIRAQKLSSCEVCENKVENFEDLLYTERFLQTKQKYFFFLPRLVEGYGDKPEGFLEQCSRVWEYRKLEEPGLPPIIRLKRYLLHSTKCDKCVVTGCLQSRCVPVGEEESCPQGGGNDSNGTRCKPLMDYGICHFNSKHNRCLWTSVTDDGIKSRRPIKECLGDNI